MQNDRYFYGGFDSSSPLNILGPYFPPLRKRHVILIAPLFHVSNIRQLLQGLNLPKKFVLGVLFPYYIFTILNALLEGVGMVLLVNIFTGGFVAGGKSGLPAYISEIINVIGGSAQLPGVVPLLIALFGINLIIRFGLLVFDGSMSAVLRRRLQEAIFSHYLMGDWSHMRNFRVGDAVGTNTQEAMIVTKYLTSAVSAIYFILGALVISGLAIIISFKISLVLGLIALPLAVLMQKTFGVQARLSRRSAALRNDFSGDITDRFNGLLQVHVDDNYDFHLRQGLQTQDRLTRLDMLIGVCGAVIGSFNLLLPLTALIGFSVWLFIMGSDNVPNLALIASVGVLGMRVASQLNGAVASVGNLSRLSGSLYPVLNALSVPAIPVRQLIDEPVVRVKMDNVSYAYGHHTAIDGVTLVAEKGAPLVLSGRSGKGKTTLANLIAGLYFPCTGRLIYVAASGTAFASTSYRARVGFVTQDIYLFRGSLRSNLTAGRDCNDEQIWAVLEQVDAAEFVRAMGGLDTESAEAGRSLSGGQRRRLGIARVLLSGSDILIFDEVTAGLDQVNKAAVLSVIERLSETYIVVVISHEELSLSCQTSYSV